MLHHIVYMIVGMRFVVWLVVAFVVHFEVSMSMVDFVVDNCYYYYDSIVIERMSNHVDYYYYELIPFVGCSYLRLFELLLLMWTFCFHLTYLKGTIGLINCLFID